MLCQSLGHGMQGPGSLATQLEGFSDEGRIIPVESIDKQSLPDKWEHLLFFWGRTNRAARQRETSVRVITNFSKGRVKGMRGSNLQ